jgi:GNAT superfamily N-acetyltransferase
MPKGCKYIYNNKTYTKEEFMALLAGGEYRNILAEYDQTPKVEAQEGREVVNTVKTFKAKSSVGGKFNVNLFADLTDEQGKTKLDKLREEGYIVDNADVFSFAGSDNVFTMVPDNKMVGDLSYGKEIVYDEKTKQPKESKDRVVLQGNGGIYFAVKFNDDGTFWASTPQIARSIIKQINDAIDKNGSPAYVVVSKGSNRKVLSSVDGMIATVDTIAYMVEDGDIPLSVFRNAMSSAVKTSGYTGKDLFPMNISGKDMHKSIKDLFMKAEFSSFEKRKQVVTNLIRNIFDKKSNGNLINFESLGNKLGFPLKNKEDIIDSFGKNQEEGFISEVPSQSAYAVIEIPSKLKLEDESSKDPSERRHIAYAGVMKTQDGQRVKVHMLKDRLNFLDFMTDSKGTPLSEMEERSALGKAGHGQVPFIKAGIKTKSRVSASPEQFSGNVAETIDKIKAATSEDGATLNLDGTVYEDGGLVVPATSVNVGQGQVTAEGLYDFLKQNEGNISSDIFKIGLYKFPDRPEVSYDLNIVIPREHRDVALEFGKLAGQESLFDLDSYENIKTGSDGKNPINFTPEQLASIAEDLSMGKLPDIEGMLKGTQAGTDTQDASQIIPDKVDVEIIDKKSQYYKEAKDLVSSNVITYGEPRLVIVEKGKVVAALTLEDSDFEYKADMAVDKSERNKGLSKKLIDGMIRDFVKSDLEQIRLEVTNKNLLNNLTNNFGFESEWNEDAGADYAYMSKKQAEAYVKNNDKAGQQSLVEDKFKQYEKGYNKMKAAEGGAKKRKANEDLKNILADSPSAKYIIDNMSYIYKQLEDKGLASKNDQCPI